MEPYIRENTGNFPLSSLAEETTKGVGITGASVPSRALLGLKALYAAVDINRRERARCGPGKKSPSSSQVYGGAVVSSPGARGGGGGSGGATGNRSAKEKQGIGGDGGEGGGGGWRSVPPAPQSPPPPTARVSAASFAAMPLLGHRYKYVSMIGTGRFSDVIRAEDTFRPGRSVAIKVINIGCGAVAVREVRFMRFLGSIPKADFCPVVKLLDVLTYRGHYCLVMELFDGSLSDQEFGGDAGHPEDSRAAAPAPAITLDYARRGTGGPARGSALGLCDQGMRDDRGGGGLQRCGDPAELGSRPGRAVWGGDGVGGGGGSGSSWSCCGRADTSRESGSGRRGASPGSSPSPSPSSSSSSGEACPAHVIRHVALQLVSALLLLRNHGLIHADIKPENVLLKAEEGRRRGEAAGRGQESPARRVGVRDLVRGRALMGGTESLTVRLCDFGNAIHKSEAYLYYGDFEIQTLAYRAPEVLMGCPFGPAVDTWSVGVILLELLMGRPLFDTAGSRAALLQQMVCAFGPMPLRRFRVGHFFSEYYSQDQSLTVGTSTSSPRDRHAEMGCCSCCWIGNKLSIDGGLGQQANPNRTARGSSCDGCCAHRCRRPGRHSEGTTPLQPAAGRRMLGSAGPTGSSGRGVAHAHLSRLISAAGDAVSPPPPGSSAGASSRSSSASEQDRRQQANPGVSKPRPRRFVSSTSGVARQNPRLMSLLAGLLCFDPDERLTPRQALSHPFFGEALPFAALPQTAAAAAAAAVAEHPRKAPAVEPAAASRAKELGDGGSAASSTRHGNGASVARESHPPAASRRSPSLARPSSRQQQEPSSPRLRCNGSSGGLDNARRDAASTGTNRPKNGNNRPLDVPGVAAAAAAPAAARLSLPSPPGGAASGNGKGPLNPSCEVDSSSSSAGVDVDPTAQLRRLAEMAGAMVSKGSNRYSRGGDSSGTGTGGGGGSDTYSTAPLPSPRRNPFLNAEIIARLKREDPPADSRKPGVSGTPIGRQQQANHSSSKTPPASRRRPNPFLTPATLAILNPDLGVRKEVRAAAAVAAPTVVAGAAAAEIEGGQAAVERLGWGGRRATSAATMTATTPAARKYPAKRDKVTPSPEGKKHSGRATPTRAATRAVGAAHQTPPKNGMQNGDGEKGRGDLTPCEKRQPGGTPSTTKRKRTRRSPRAADSSSHGATPSRAREGGRMTTPRRAAVAAGVAILRLRDDESSDGSLTL